MASGGQGATLKPAKVAIVGGGCAGLAAAFELSRPVHQDRFQVTVYQQGWRLGGKGASGRGFAGRIEEHGLHIWLGSYENSFRMLRDVYGELAAHPLGSAHGDWRDAFSPEPDIGIFAPTQSDEAGLWSSCFPPRPGFPGDPDAPDSANLISVYLAGALSMLRTLLMNTNAAPIEDVEARIDDWPAALTRLIDKGVLAGAAGVAQALGLISVALSRRNEKSSDTRLMHLAQHTAATLRDWVEQRFLANHPDRHIWLVAELVIASIIGAIRHGLFDHPEGLDAIDDWDSREWLRANGASEAAVQSPFMQGLYDFAMAYEDGDPSRPRLAAGAALRGTMRMFFGYRGALFWRMRAGMGDVVFAPLYECLKRRGVQFRFFHRLRDVVLAEAGRHVAALRFDEQARPRVCGEYDPLVMVAGRPCWPAAPLWQRLEQGEELRDADADLEADSCEHKVGEIEVKVGRDFDFVVLAVGVGAIPQVAGQILACQPRWRAMTRHVKTAATQSFQLWLTRDLIDLGWRSETQIAAGGAKPFDTFCDMAHVVPEEGWLEAEHEVPATAVYFCGVLPDDPSLGGPNLERAQQARVRDNALRFLNGTAANLWPGFAGNDAFDWNVVAGGSEAVGAYFRANINATDRYTLSVPGSTRWRISPLDLDYDNLTVAGDWTACGLNTGCTESAVMSGMLAAHALSGLPRLETITGYDHP